LAPLPKERKSRVAAKPKGRISACLTAAFAARRIDGQTAAAALSAMQIALYQPDIAQNTGTILRLAACLGVEAHIVEPAGFPTSDRAFRRAGMDYLDQVQLTRHAAWAEFERWRRDAKLRLVLLTTRAQRSYLDHAFAPDDVVLFGRESSGVPEEIHAAADARLVIPMRPGLRSLNVAMACAMTVGEALRQEGRLGPPLHAG